MECWSLVGHHDINHRLGDSYRRDHVERRVQTLHERRLPKDLNAFKTESANGGWAFLSSP